MEAKTLLLLIGLNLLPERWLKAPTFHINFKLPSRRFCLFAGLSKHFGHFISKDIIFLPRSSAQGCFSGKVDNKLVQPLSAFIGNALSLFRRVVGTKVCDCRFPILVELINPFETRSAFHNLLTKFRAKTKITRSTNSQFNYFPVFCFTGSHAGNVGCRVTPCFQQPERFCALASLVSLVASM